MKTLLIALSVSFVGVGCGGADSSSDDSSSTQFGHTDYTPSTLSLNLDGVVALGTAETEASLRLSSSGSNVVALDAQAKVLEGFQKVGRSDEIRLAHDKNFKLQDGRFLMKFAGFAEIEKKGVLDDPRAPHANDVYDLAINDTGLNLRADCGFVIVISNDGTIECLTKDLEGLRGPDGDDLHNVHSDNYGNVYFQWDTSVVKFTESGATTLATDVRGVSVNGMGTVFTNYKDKGRIITADGKSRTLEYDSVHATMGDYLLFYNWQGVWEAYKDSTTAIRLTYVGTPVSGARMLTQIKTGDNVFSGLYDDGSVLTMDFNALTVTNKGKLNLEGESILSAAFADANKVVFATASGVYEDSPATALSLTDTKTALMTNVDCFSLVVRDGEVVFSGLSNEKLSTFVTGKVDLETKVQTNLNETSLKITGLNSF